MYTQSLHEYQVLGPIGWVQESVGYYIYNGVVTIDSTQSQPWYRVYNPNSGLHHWTMDANEYASLGSIGWNQEGIAGYLFQTQVTGSVPLFRLYNPNDGNHHWTMSENEKNTIVALGWNDEGISGYVFASGD